MVHWWTVTQSHLSSLAGNDLCLRHVSQLYRLWRKETDCALIYDPSEWMLFVRRKAAIIYYQTNIRLLPNVLSTDSKSSSGTWRSSDIKRSPDTKRSPASRGRLSFVHNIYWGILKPANFQPNLVIQLFPPLPRLPRTITLVIPIETRSIVRAAHSRARK